VELNRFYEKYDVSCECKNQKLTCSMAISFRDSHAPNTTNGCSWVVKYVISFT
jgi:hypothetical protein